jgi:hypothetical protein
MAYISQVHRNLADRERGEREGHSGDLEASSRWHYGGPLREAVTRTKRQAQQKIVNQLLAAQKRSSEAADFECWSRAVKFFGLSSGCFSEACS